MITIDDKEYRNLQEQVGYLTEELKKIKQSLGSALPEPIEGPQGPQGETGPTGPQGRSPRIGFGYGPLPDDDSFQDGDIFIARGIGLTKGNLYRKVNGSWQLELNLVGPQGPIGPLNESNVIANPESNPVDDLIKISIDGITYNIKANNETEVTESKVLSTTGRILTDWSELGPTEDIYIIGTGEELQSDYRKTTGYIKTKPGVKVKVKDMYLYVGDSTIVMGVVCYDKDKNFMAGYGISNNTSSPVTAELIIPEGCYFIKISDSIDSTATFEIP
jgi:hypothetical protein